jgi:hypothetical protein
MKTAGAAQERVRHLDRRRRLCRRSGETPAFALCRCRCSFLCLSFPRQSLEPRSPANITPMPAPENPAKNKLYYGDNLAVLRDYIPSSSVDLIYLDPPFNSRQDYNVLFAEKDGARSASQITAFKDTWEWNEEAARSYESVAEAMRAFHTIDCAWYLDEFLNRARFSSSSIT